MLPLHRLHMDSAIEPTATSRSRNHSSNPANAAPPSSSPPTYGYHNTFHTHAQLPQGTPPTYARAVDSRALQYLNERSRIEAEDAERTLLPPAYDCSVQLEGVIGIKQELSSPFTISSHREWNDAYVILRGTQLSIHRVKTPGLLSKHRAPTAGRLLKTYTLQHAEAGVATDFKKTALVPKSPFAHLVPAAARPKLYETDPHLFEPVREHAIRVRLELEQFLLCPPTQEAMLDWVESLCASIDISSPLEDRCEPRYRSLPRRTRRQRILDGGENIEHLTSLEVGRRIIAQQEQIIRTLYPHLAATREPGQASASPMVAELELDDFDPEDVRFPTRLGQGALTRMSVSQEDENADDVQMRPDTGTSSSDPKSAHRYRPTPTQILRYRRRCAPVLLMSSPRVSDVVFAQGKRVRINIKEHVLVEYTSLPPRYDAHAFPKSKRPARIAISRPPITATPALSEKIENGPVTHPPVRPSSPTRGQSDDSITSISFGDDMVHAQSSAGSDDADTGSSSPPSPTGISHVKTEATRQIEGTDKRRTSEDSREVGLSAVALGVGLLI